MTQAHQIHETGLEQAALRLAPHEVVKPDLPIAVMVRETAGLQAWAKKDEAALKSVGLD